jgi:hypothetical protein
MQTLSPKHTDSQVPLQMDAYNDNDDDDDDDINLNGRDNSYMIADDVSDSDAGLRLKIPFYQNETGF